jgi:hypothetical protein
MSKSINKKIKNGQQAIVKMAKHSVDQLADFSKKRYLGKNAATNIARDLRLIRTMFNTELKHIDTLLTSTTVQQGTTLVTPCGVTGTGTSNTSRVGESVRVNRIDLQLQFAYSNGTTNSICGQIFKYWLVRYLKTPSTSGSTAFTLSEFLNTDSGATNITPMSFHNPDTMENFQILACDQVAVTVPYGTTVDNSHSVIKEVTVDCNFHQTYNGSSGSNICDNMCFVVFVAQKPTNTGGVSTVLCSTRTWFVDN